MIVKRLRTATIADQLAATETSFADRPSPLAPFTGERPPGFLETAYLSFRTNSIVGQLGNAISTFGHNLNIGTKVDRNFNPYDMMTDDFLQEHPYIMDDFESGRVLDIPNREAFFYYLAKKQDDYQMRARAGRGGFVANMAGMIAPDLGVYAATGALGRVTGVNPVLADWLSKGSTSVRIAKGMALGTVANVTNEGILEFINQDRNVDEQEAFLNAAVWGAAFGAAVPALGKAYGAGKEALVNTSWGRRIQSNNAKAIAQSTSLSKMPEAIKAQNELFDDMLSKPMDGSRVINPLLPDGQYANAADAAPGSISHQLHESAVKVERLKEKAAKEGYALHIERHPHQDYLSHNMTMDDIDALSQTAPASGIVGKAANLMNYFFPQGKARRMPSGYARFINRIFFDDAALLAGNIADPLNFKNNPSAESMLPAIRGLHQNTLDIMGDFYDGHFKAKGGTITVTLSGGQQVTIERGLFKGGWSKYREAVMDRVRQVDELRRGARDTITVDHPAINQAADQLAPYATAMLDRADQAGLLQGPRALARAQVAMAELQVAQKAVTDELAGLGPAPAGPVAKPARASTRSPGYKDAYKQRLAELEAIAPGDKGNKAMAKELARQDVQQALDAQAAKANAELDAYTVKRAEIEGRSAKAGEAAASAAAKVKEIENFIADAPHYFHRRWLGHKIAGRKDDFTKRLAGQFQRNREIDFKTGKALAERPIVSEALDRLPAEDRAILRGIDDESMIGDADLAFRYREAVAKYDLASAEAVYEKLTHIDNAHGIIDAIDSMPDPLKKRVLQINETDFVDYLDNDIQSVLRHYDHQMSGRIATQIAINEAAPVLAPMIKTILGEEFEASVSQIQRAANKHFDMLLNDAVAAGDATLANKIRAAKETQGQIFDIKLNELQGRPPASSGNAAADAGVSAAGRTALRMPFLSMLGNTAVTQIMDFAGVVMMSGLDGRKINILTSTMMQLGKTASKRGLEALAAAADQTTHRYLHLEDIVSPGNIPPAATRIGRAVQSADRATAWMADKFGVATGLNWMTSFSKRATAHLILDELVNGAKKMSKADALVKGGMAQGKAFHQVGLALEDAQRMSRLGFNADESNKLIDVLTANASTFDGAPRWADRDGFMNHKGHISPEYSKWYDSDRGMYDRLVAAVNSEVDNIIVTPKLMSRPFMNARWLGKVVNQFQNFAYAWTNQLAVNVGQRPGGDQAVYFMTILGLASVSDAIHNHVSGRRGIDETVALWSNPNTSMAMAYKAVDRSGIMSWLSRPLGIADRHGFGMSRLLNGDNVSSRYHGNTAGFIGHAGPLFDYAERLGRGVTGVPMRGDPRSWNLLRTTLPFQNLLGINAVYRGTKMMGLDNPIGPGNGIDLFPLPTKPFYEYGRPQREPEP